MPRRRSDDIKNHPGDGPALPPAPAQDSVRHRPGRRMGRDLFLQVVMHHHSARPQTEVACRALVYEIEALISVKFISWKKANDSKPINNCMGELIE